MNPIRFLLTFLITAFQLRISEGIAGFTVNSSSGAPDELIGSNADDIQGRKYTLLSGQSVVRGQVLGMVTATGKLVSSLSAATNGSEVPFGISEQTVDATSGDKDILVYVQGSFNEHALTLGAGWTTASVRLAFLAGGRIMLETPVKRYP